LPTVLLHPESCITNDEGLAPYDANEQGFLLDEMRIEPGNDGLRETLGQRGPLGACGGSLLRIIGRGLNSDPRRSQSQVILWNSI
jgi:hypothetical protein